MKRVRQILVGMSLLVGVASSATLPYQGLATDSKGNPVADANGAVGFALARFALYSSATGGTALWNEAQTITTSKGLFSVNLGSVTSIPDSLFNGSPLYLGVTVNGASEASPRLALGSVPAAFVAKHADSTRAAKVADSAHFAPHADTAKMALSLVGADSARLDSLVARTKADSVTLKIARDSVQALTNLLSGLQSSLFPSNGVLWNGGVSYGTLVDIRDGQLYRTVTIGTQTWMAQNLNYAGSGTKVGVCYGSRADSCAKYGRLYTWSEAMGVDSAYNTKLLTATLPARGVCPTGWHVPSDAEWSTLQRATGDSGVTDGTKLKSTSGWSTNTGTDSYGFRALPGGYELLTVFYSASDVGYWWSATEYDATNAWNVGMFKSVAYVSRNHTGKSIGISLRCVKN